MSRLLSILRGQMNILSKWKNPSETQIIALRKSELMLGCMSDQELLDKWYNGSTPDRAKRPSKDAPPLFNTRKSSYEALMDWRDWVTDQFARDRIDDRREWVEQDNLTDPVVVRLKAEHDARR